MLNNTITLISFVAGDKGYQLNFTCTDSNNVIINLTNATMTFNAQLDNDSAVQVTGSITVLSGPAGTCYYTLTGTDFTLAGTYNAQIVASFSAGAEKMTFDGITLTVDSRVPQ